MIMILIDYYTLFRILCANEKKILEIMSLYFILR